MSYEAKRCGVQFSPPAIILLYEHKGTNQVRKRIIPVRNFSKYSGRSSHAPSIIVCKTIDMPLDPLPRHHFDLFNQVVCGGFK